MLAQIVLPKGRISGQQSVCQRRRAAGNRILSNLRKMRPLSLPLPACRTCALAAAVRAPHATLGSGRPLGLNSCQLPRPQHPNFVLKFWENAEKNPQILSHLCNRCSLSTPATQVHSLEQPDAILCSRRGHDSDSRQLPNLQRPNFVLEIPGNTDKSSRNLVLYLGTLSNLRKMCPLSLALPACHMCALAVAAARAPPAALCSASIPANCLVHGAPT